MKTIIINNGQLISVEDDDFERLSMFTWYQYNGSHVYRCEKSKSGVLTNSGNVRTEHISVANEIFGTRGKKYDHKDLNPLNNLRDNIRPATSGQNGMNRRKFMNGHSQYKGPSFYKAKGKWISQIMKDGKNYWLGYFDTDIDAAKAYDKKAIELFGEFANLNFPVVPC